MTSCHSDKIPLTKQAFFDATTCDDLYSPRPHFFWLTVKVKHLYFRTSGEAVFSLSMLHLYDLILMYTTHIKIINLIFQIYVVLDSITLCLQKWTDGSCDEREMN